MTVLDFFDATRARVGALVVALTAGLPVAAVTEPLDGIAAIVNDDVVLVSELQQRYDAFMGSTRGVDPRQIPPQDIILSQLMERLVLESLQLQEAEMRGVEIDDEELTNAVVQFARNNNMDLDSFLRNLELQGISYRGFR